MATHAAKEVHKWTPANTKALIRFRAQQQDGFLKSKFSAKKLWETFINEVGLEGKVTGQQASKKWENLKKKYKDLKTPKTGCGADADEVITPTWQYFEDMHEVLGAKPSVGLPIVATSWVEDEDPGSVLLVMLLTVMCAMSWGVFSGQ